MNFIRRVLKWLDDHWGWGHFGWNPSNLCKQRINPHRQAIKRYCIDHPINGKPMSRKTAKKQMKVAKRWRHEWALERLANYTRHKILKRKIK